VAATLFFGVFFLFLACGKETTGPQITERQTIREVAVPGPMVTVTVPVQVVVTATPEPGVQGANPSPAANAKVWVAPSGLRYLAAYDEEGTLARTFDLTNAVAGSLTALAFADSRTLLAFVDPGEGGESLARIDIENGTVTAGWLTHEKLENITLRHMSVMPSPETPLRHDLFLARTGGGVERFQIDLQRNTHVLFASPWPLLATTGCPFQSSRFAIPFDLEGVRRLATWGLASTGSPSVTSARANMWDLWGAATSLSAPFASALPRCDEEASTHFGEGGEFPASLGYTPAGAHFDGVQWFVRFHHDTFPLLVRYGFDGSKVHSPHVLESNIGILTNSVSSRGLEALDHDTLIFPEWVSDSLHRISKTGTYQGVFARDAFTNNVNAMAIRP
jgi:hypothetical protein